MFLVLLFCLSSVCQLLKDTYTSYQKSAQDAETNWRTLFSTAEVRTDKTIAEGWPTSAVQNKIQADGIAEVNTWIKKMQTAKDKFNAMCSSGI